MKKIAGYLTFLFLLIVSFVFIGFLNTQTIGQTSSSLNSSGCPQVQTDCFGEPSGCGSQFGIYDPKICMCICPGSSSSNSSGVVALNKNFTGIWKARITKPIGSNTSSSSSGECVICIQIVPKCSLAEELVPQTCNECAHCTRGGALTSLNSNGQAVFKKTLAHISSGFSGSRIITFKLCVKNKKLEGTIQQTGVIEKGTITSQNVISENEVDVTFKDKRDVSANIKLKLIGERRFIGTFADKHTFEARKISSFIRCLLSTTSSSGGFKDCDSKGSCRGPNGTYLSCPEGTQCSGLPAYGCYPPGCPYPICCSPDTRIRTTGVQKRIADIKEGDLVLTDGEKPVHIIKTSKVEVKNHKILRVKLNDGIVLEVSPGHPTADGRLFKDLMIGDVIDSHKIIESKLIQYNYKYTYDILPGSETGHYYANGVLVGSTLARKK